MRHRKSGRRLGVPMHRRKAMLKQLVEALFLHGRIKTTLARAKETRSVAEKMVTLAKKGTLHHRRKVMAYISRKDVVNRLFDHIVEWYKERQGGYTRIIKIGNRAGDAASVAFLELVDWIPGEKLLGQLTKVEKSETGEEDGKDAKEKEKAKKKKDAKKAKTEEKPKEKKKKVVKSADQEKRISERKAEKDKGKKDRAAEREKVKKDKTEKKAAAKSEKAAAPKKTKKTVKKVKKKSAPRKKA